MANTVERRRAWNAIIAFGQQTMAWHAIVALVRRTRSNDVGCGMHHLLWAAYTVERRRAWHAIMALGQHTRLDDIGQCMPFFTFWAAKKVE